jgi:hypothetical protein
MWPQENGETMEYGSMENPIKKVVEKYEECWIDLLVGEVEGEKEKISWCYTTEGASGERGMVIRIGEYIQAVVRKGTEVSVARWKWSVGKGWEVVVTTGDIQLPQSLFETRKVVEIGDTGKGKDSLDWVCIEVFKWS